MNKYILIVLGIILLLIGLWGGSYLLERFPYESNYNFASWTTGLFTCILGIILVGLGIDRGTKE